MQLLRFPTFISLFTFSLVQMGWRSAGRILDLIKAETELDENAGRPRGPIGGEIVFENVTFAYGGRAGRWRTSRSGPRRARRSRSSARPARARAR